MIEMGQAAEALALLEAIPMKILVQMDLEPGLPACLSGERARGLMALRRATEMLRQAVMDMKAAKVPGWKVERYERLL